MQQLVLLTRVVFMAHRIPATQSLAMFRNLRLKFIFRDTVENYRMIFVFILCRLQIEFLVITGYRVRKRTDLVIDARSLTSNWLVSSEKFPACSAERVNTRNFAGRK